jgi:hypothetical protein
MGVVFIEIRVSSIFPASSLATFLSFILYLNPEVSSWYLLISTPKMGTGDPRIQVLQVKETRSKKEGSSTQLGLKWKGIGPRGSNLDNSKEMGQFLEPTQGRIQDKARRESSRSLPLMRNLSILIAMCLGPCILLDQVK